MRDKYEVARIKKTYRRGMHIRLLKMDDIQAPPIGCEGVVQGVDGIGSVMVTWDTGSTLNVVPGVDEFEVLEDCDER